MNKKLKNQLRHKAGIYSLFSRGNIFTAILLALCMSFVYGIFTYGTVEDYPLNLLVPLIVALFISIVFVYLLGRVTYSDIESASDSMQVKIGEKLLLIEVEIKELSDKIAKNPAPARFLDEREADLYDLQKEKEKLLATLGELQKVPFEFN